MSNQKINITGKRILLVGSTGVLGRVYASELAKIDNIQLVIADTNQTDVLLYAEELGVLGVEIDVAFEASVIDCLKYVKSQLGGLDSVINNAAATGESLINSGEAFANFEDYPLTVWKKTIDINLTGIFLVAREAGRLIKATSKQGSLINISSIYGVVGPDHRIYEYKSENGGDLFYNPVAYSTSKSALVNLTKYIAVYWAKSGVRANLIGLGGVFNHQDDKFMEGYCARVPMGRMAKDDEYNGTVIYLMSDASSYVTGATIMLDGGWTAW